MCRNVCSTTCKSGGSQVIQRGLVKGGIRSSLADSPVEPRTSFATSPRFWSRQENKGFSFAFHLHLSAMRAPGRRRRQGTGRGGGGARRRPAKETIPPIRITQMSWTGFLPRVGWPGHLLLIGNAVNCVLCALRLSKGWARQDVHLVVQTGSIRRF